MERVDVNELRQNASAVIHRVEESGAAVEVTVQGWPAATIEPIGRARVRRRTVSSAELEAGLAELRVDETDWAEEVHASRDDDGVEGP
jgi:antitoxin (DNA-binding transcriptional repressor) of toxin-antitoxin stability system